MSNMKLAIPTSVIETPMKLVDVQQGSKEWLDWRAQGITASDIPIIMGLSPYKTIWQLWAEKIGFIETQDISNNPNVKRGKRLEDEARQLAEKRYGDVLLPLCGEYTLWPTLRASFDGLDNDNKSNEFKAPGDSVWDELVENGRESPTYKMYEAQVHGQCLVAGNPNGRLMFYRECGKDITFEITLSESRATEILECAQAFKHMVDTKTPPRSDPQRDWYLPASGDDHFRWETLADDWLSVDEKIKSLESDLKALKSEKKDVQDAMINLMGCYLKSNLCGVSITRFEKKGNVDYEKFLADKFSDENLSDELDSYRKPSRDDARVSRAKNTLFNYENSEVVFPDKVA